MPLYSNATFSPVQWLVFPRLALRSFQGCFVVLRSFQGCVPFVPAAAVASRSKIFMGLQYIVCARCPRGGGVHRERCAVFCYGFSMVLAGSTSRLGFFFHLAGGGSSMLLLACSCKHPSFRRLRVPSRMCLCRFYPCFELSGRLVGGASGCLVSQKSTRCVICPAARSQYLQRRRIQRGPITVRTLRTDRRNAKRCGRPAANYLIHRQICGLIDARGQRVTLSAHRSAPVTPAGTPAAATADGSQKFHRAGGTRFQT